ncbi:MAG TPA: hypothetical protein VFV73_21660 [Streptosporangiaceae bacterium]|nr:hypothetical protein [Streptosporangiaceae bacterium]
MSLDLIDPSRPDPWVPGIPFREMVVSVLYPAREVGGHPREPYFTPIVARAYEQQIGVPVPLSWPITHARRHAPVLRREGGWPVVLYAPGLGDERNDTTAIAEDLASHGYVVVTIDFVHDSGVVELPDGPLAESAVPEPTLPVTIKEVVSRILGEPASWVTALIGTINGPRAVTVERTYIKAWFDTYLGHHDNRLLAGPSPLFPEVEFVR